MTGYDQVGLVVLLQAVDDVGGGVHGDEGAYARIGAGDVGA